MRLIIVEIVYNWATGKLSVVAGAAAVNSDLNESTIMVGVS